VRRLLASLLVLASLSGASLALADDPLPPLPDPPTPPEPPPTTDEPKPPEPEDKPPPVPPPVPEPLYPEEPPTPPEEAPKAAPAFGKRASFVFAIENVFAISSEKVSGTKSSDDTQGFFGGLFGPRIGLQRIFDSGLTLGTVLGLGHLGTGDEGTLVISILPRIGYVRALAPQFAFWLRTGPSLRFAAQTGRTDNKSGNWIGWGGEIELVYAPVHHFGFSFGPAFDFGLTGTNDTKDSTYTYLGFQMGLLADL